MADVQPFPSPQDTLDQLLSRARDDARDSVSTVWDELSSRVQRHFETALEERAQAGRLQGAGRVRRQFSKQLTQTLRRLRTFEDDARWSSALLDTTTALCDRAALFIARDTLHLQAVRGMIIPPDFKDLRLADAPAFANVEQTRDTVVALRSAGELSPQVADMVGEHADARCWLFPVNTQERMAAVLYADADEHIEIEALELVTGIAGLVLDGLRPQNQLVSIAAAEDTAPAPPGSWAALSREEQELHLRAQRFARVRAARLLLDREDDVQKGRREHDLYSCLKNGIDSAREAFRREFLDAPSTMVDYLHLELLRTVANDDPMLLGSDYPGPMA